MVALVPAAALPGDFEGVVALPEGLLGVRDFRVVVGTVVVRSGVDLALGSVASVGSMKGLSVIVIISLRSVTGVDGADDGAF